MGEATVVGRYLVDILGSQFGATSSVAISGFPSGSATVSEQNIAGTSFTFTSLDTLETLVLAHTSTADYELSIENLPSIPVIVLPVASRPILEAPSNIVDDSVVVVIQRTDPLERLSVELRLGHDRHGETLGSIEALINIPGFELRHEGNGVYRIEPGTNQTPDSIENAYNHLFDGNIVFVPNPSVEFGKYAEGIHVIVTSSEADGDGQVATASSAIFLPVSITRTFPTSSPVSVDKIQLVEDIPKAVGSDIIDFINRYLPSVSGNFELSGIPAGYTVSFLDNEEIRNVSIYSAEDVVVFPGVSAFGSLEVTAPPQSGEDFVIRVLSEKLGATLNIPVHVLAVADKPNV